MRSNEKPNGPRLLKFVPEGLAAAPFKFLTPFIVVVSKLELMNCKPIKLAPVFVPPRLVKLPDVVPAIRTSSARASVAASAKSVRVRVGLTDRRAAARCEP